MNYCENQLSDFILKIHIYLLIHSIKNYKPSFINLYSIVNVNIQMRCFTRHLPPLINSYKFQLMTISLDSTKSSKDHSHGHLISLERWQVCLSSLHNTLFWYYWPFAVSDYVVETPPCKRAKYHLWYPKQSNLIQLNLNFLCFVCPSA